MVRAHLRRYRAPAGCGWRRTAWKIPVLNEGFNWVRLETADSERANAALTLHGEQRDNDGVGRMGVPGWVGPT